MMIENGLIDEVFRLMEMGIPKASTAMQAIGYKEIIKYMENKISLDEAIDIIKMESRRYAKRQLTWFRRDENVQWIDIENDSISDKIEG